MKLILKNFRCFDGLHEIEIRPLTLITGENSSGKTSMIAALNVISDKYRYPMNPDFNSDPFNLGNYRTIATYKGGRYGRADSFSLGMEISSKEAPLTKVVGKYTERDGNPDIAEITGETGFGSYRMLFEKEQIDLNVDLFETNGTSKRSLSTKIKRIEYVQAPAGFFQNAFFSTIFTSFMENKDLEKLFPQVYQIIYNSINMLPSVRAVAPVRSKPSRTYDQSKADYSPEGAHIPQVLTRLYVESQTSKKAALLLELIRQFGSDSGLFKELKPRILGKHFTDPFQLNVSVSGIQSNMIDVGYGVSQSLPIVVQSILSDAEEILLLQQPEVHLHPKAQAAMGTLFARLCKEHRKNTYVIETHSDFIADRVRMAVAEGIIKPEDVLILYFEKQHLTTRVHHLFVDDKGDLVNPPQSYREFFMREQMSLLSMRAKG
jgi:AAA15 family ATPase/GTPase